MARKRESKEDRGRRIHDRRIILDNYGLAGLDALNAVEDLGDDNAIDAIVNHLSRWRPKMRGCEGPPPTPASNGRRPVSSSGDRR